MKEILVNITGSPEFEAWWNSEGLDNLFPSMPKVITLSYKEIALKAWNAARNPKYSLDDLLEGMTPENVHPEI